MKSKDEAKKQYIDYIPDVKKVDKWYEKFNFVLVESMKDLRDIFNDYKAGSYFMAFDTETTGLDFEEAEIVGYSFCLDGKTAYYVPVYHFNYKGNLGTESLDFIYEKMKEARVVFMYNARYDMRIMEYHGYQERREELDKKRWKFVRYDMSKINYFDVAVAVWLSDTNIKFPSLKGSSRKFLGIEQMHFDEVIESAGSFFYLDPSENEDTVFYAAADALCTYLLVPATIKYYKESKMAGKVDNKVLYPLMHYENEKLWLDGELIKKYEIEATAEVDRLEKEVYDMFGYQINLNSPIQVGQAFDRLGIDTGERTATGNMAVGIKVLDKLSEEVINKYPALKSYVRYKEMAKLLSSYILPFKKAYEKGGFLRVAYKTSEVPSGRFACGKDGKNSFFSKINTQCVVGDSSLFTENGLKHIKDVNQGDRVWDGETFRNILWVFDNGDQEVYRVTLSNGQYLDCTESHQLYSATESCDFRELKDLNVGDLVAFNSKGYNISSSSVLIDTPQRDKPKGGLLSRVYTVDLSRPRFWHFVGCFIGDGCYLGKNKKESYGVQIIFNKDEVETLNYVKETLNELGIKYRIKEINNGNYKTLYNLIVKSVGMSDLFCDLGIGHRAENKAIPKIVFSLSYECRKMLMRGLMDSDGRAMLHNEWSYCTVSKVLSRDFTQLATSLGINSHCIERENGKYRNAFKILLLGNKVELYEKIGITSKYKARYIMENGNLLISNPTMGKIHSKLPKCLYNSVISNKLCNEAATNRYVKKDGSVSIYVDRSKINTRFDLYRGRLKDFNFNVHWVKIKSIELLGKRSVYDIHVDTTNRYCVNGFITHNSIPKAHVKMEDVFDLGQRDLFSKKDNIIMGYKFSYSNYDDNGNYIKPDDPTYIGQVEGMNDKLNLRMTITPKMYEDSEDEEFVYCSFDYSAEEIRITANISREPTWVNAFTHDQDIHESTAKAVWGEENYNRDYRKKAKFCNFGIIYGMSAKSFADNPIFGFKNIDEAEEFYGHFKSSLSTLFSWEDRVQERARRVGTVYTYFGRPRRLRSYYQTGKYGFANRSAVNTIVQGTAGDIMRIVMCKLWKRLFDNDEYRDDVAWRLGIHDEIGYTVRTSRLLEILDIIKETQTVKIKEWPVNIVTDPSIGWSMGRVYDFHRVEDDTELGYHYEPDLV